MIRKIMAMSAAATIAIALAGCTDSKVHEDATLSLSNPGAMVSKVELVDALWGLNEEPLPDAECLAASTFQIPASDAFDIRKNASQTDENQAEAVIISNVNISFTDETVDGRGASCGTGELFYIVSVNEESPIDIVSSIDIKARHSVANIAKDAATPYPTCLITAHFERSGVEVCEDTDGEDTSDDEVIPEDDDEAVTDDDEAVTDDDEGDQDIEDDDVEDAEDEEDEADDDGVVILVPGALKAQGFKATYVDEPVSCGDEPVYSVRMVVDDFNCRMQGVDDDDDEFDAEGVGTLPNDEASEEQEDQLI